MEHKCNKYCKLLNLSQIDIVIKKKNTTTEVDNVEYNDDFED